MKLSASELGGLLHAAVAGLCVSTKNYLPCLMLSGETAAHFTVGNEDGTQLQVTVSEVERTPRQMGA